MRLAGSDDPPFVELGGLTRLFGLHAVATAVGRPILVLAARSAAGVDRIEFIDALDGTAAGQIALGDWTVNSGELLTRVASLDGTPMVFGGFDYQPLRLWSIPDGRVVGQWSLKRRRRALDLTGRAGGLVAVVAGEDCVDQLDAETGAPAGPQWRAVERAGLLRRRPSVRLWCVAAAGPHVFAGDADGTVWRWDAESGAVSAMWPAVHRGPIVRLTASSTVGRTVVATVGSDMTACWWDADSGQQIVSAPLRDDMPRPLALPPSTLLVAGDARIQAFDAATGSVGDDLARWLLDDRPPDDQPMIEEMCAVDVYETPTVFAGTLDAIWRLPVL